MDIYIYNCIGKIIKPKSYICGSVFLRGKFSDQVRKERTLMAIRTQTGGGTEVSSKVSRSVQRGVYVCVVGVVARKGRSNGA